MNALSHKISSLLHSSRKEATVCVSLAFVLSAAAQERCVDFRENIPLDSIRLSDPFILPDSASHTYYMTGTGGLLWKSSDLKTWSGPWRVAYSDNGRLDGHWTQESDPITPHNYGHSMIFRTFDGRTLMCIHSHKDVNGEFVRVPHLFEINLTGDKLKVGNLVK